MPFKKFPYLTKSWHIKADYSWRTCFFPKKNLLFGTSTCPCIFSERLDSAEFVWRTLLINVRKSVENRWIAFLLYRLLLSSVQFSLHQNSILSAYSYFCDMKHISSIPIPSRNVRPLDYNQYKNGTTDFKNFPCLKLPPFSPTIPTV